MKTSADSVEVESQSEDGNNVDLMFGQGHPLKNSLVRHYFPPPVSVFRGFYNSKVFL